MRGGGGDKIFFKIQFFHTFVLFSNFQKFKLKNLPPKISPCPKSSSCQPNQSCPVPPKVSKNRRTKNYLSTSNSLSRRLTSKLIDNREISLQKEGSRKSQKLAFKKDKYQRNAKKWQRREMRYMGSITGTQVNQHNTIHSLRWCVRFLWRMRRISLYFVNFLIYDDL